MYIASTELAIVRIGPFELDLASRELRKHGTRLRLQGQPFKVLVLLASQAGRVVTRAELQQEIWGEDTNVDFEHGLNFCIGRIREALGDRAIRPRYIETLPRRGYRFLMQPEVMGSSPELMWRVAGGNARTTRLVSISVSHFRQVGEHRSQDWLTDAITEAVTANLTQIGNLKVLAEVPPLSSTTAVGSEVEQRACKTDLLLDGSVTRIKDRVRITARLIHTKTERHLWAETYEHGGSDFLLVDEVARSISDEVRIRLATRGNLRSAFASRNSDVYASCLRGRYYWNKRTPGALRRAIGHFDRAIQNDSTCAEAYAGLADCYAVLGGYDFLLARECFPRAKQAAVKALELNPGLAGARTTLAFTRFFYEWDWSGAEREFKRAIDLDPNHANAHHWYSLYLAAMGRLPEALERIERAQQLDPISLIIDDTIGWIFHFARKYEHAIDRYRQTLELDSNFFPAHEGLGFAYEQKGMLKEAVEELRLAVASSDGSTRALSALGHAYGRSGKIVKARQVLEQLCRFSATCYVSSYDIAVVYIGLGEHERAIEWLVKACEERSTGMIWLKVEPRLDCLRDDKAFQSLLLHLSL